MRAVVVAEHDNQILKAGTFPTITCARELADHIQVLVIGHDAQAVAEQAARIEGVSEVCLIDHASYQHPLAEGIAEAVLSQSANADFVLAPASTFGKNFMPRVAAQRDVAQISDISRVIDKQTFERPIYAGNAIQTVRSDDDIKVITVRTTAFPAAAITEQPVAINRIEHTSESKVAFIKRELSESERPELTSARVVVSGGRALQSGENFQLLEALAAKLNAAIGASRAAVDAGYVPNDYQVGQTGKIVAPELYIAVGISGAIQHVAGMKDSKIIVAINKDADAPIFKIADYGLVGDLFEIIPELTNAL